MSELVEMSKTAQSRLRRWKAARLRKILFAAGLREMLERAGFSVAAETAILFIPGGLRMLDLACHLWCRPLSWVTAALVWPFAWLDRHVAAVRNHGYLLATVAIKPRP